LAQTYAPPPVQKPDEETLAKIKAKMEELDKAIKELNDPKVYTQLHVSHEFWPDIEIFHKAAVWILRHGEWYHKDYPKWTLEALDRGLERARNIKENKKSFPLTGRFVRGYRSLLDGSVQPYAIILPKDYRWKEGKNRRIEVILHGRDSSLTEVKFLHQFDTAAAPPDQEHIELHIYGRGNNAYRWAGDTDVLEALSHCVGTTNGALYDINRLGAANEFGPGRINIAFQVPDIDGGIMQMMPRDRIILRGFSMGGAGAWHLGLHYPDRWRSVSPGAGFTSTHGYIKNLPEKLAPYQEACLHIYDAVDYAENAANVPIVAYGGEKDPQLQAAENIAARLAPLGIPMTLLIGPDTEHRYHPEMLKRIKELQGQHAAAKRQKLGRLAEDTDPSKVHFVTYTPYFHQCYWVKMLAQERQYERSLVEAEFRDSTYRVHTENVRLLGLRMLGDEDYGKPVSIDIDGERITTKLISAPFVTDDHMDPFRNVEQLWNWMRTIQIVLERRHGNWQPTLLRKIEVDAARRPRKDNRLMGPIDIAFMRPFICVRGTGQSWHAATQRYAEANLKRFADEWNKHFRGDLPIKNDWEVDDEDLTNKNLILFGDPASNSLIAQAVDRLPMEWSKDRIAFAGKTVSAADHIPALIYPSPFALDRYVVLNSGHTFHAADFEGTNALLYPRLGDYAILKLKPTENDPLAVEVVTAGLFDENWQAPK
jgi:hypothetical protein